MPKIIASQTLAAQREKEAMQAQLEQLRTENQRLKAENTRLGRTAHGTQVARNPSISSPLTTSRAATYSLPTAASRSKSKKAEEPTEPESELEPENYSHQSPYWRDGKLVRSGKERKSYGFMAATRAFQTRAKYPSKYTGDPVWHGISDELETLWEQDHAETVDPSPSQESHVECQICNETADAWDDQNADSLRARTRLEHNAFRMCGRAQCGDEALMMIYLPMRTQARILRAGLTLAQDAIWHHVRRHWPEAQRSWWLESPREVKLGRDELIDKFGSGELMTPRSKYNRVCNQPSESVNYAILQLPELRNVVCHQSHCSSFAIDHLLSLVQSVAVILQDEHRAHRVRKLRDQVKEEARKGLLEIESLYSSSWLPENSEREWPLHLQRTFSDAIVDYRSGIHSPDRGYGRLPDFFKRAAWEWRIKTYGTRPGTQNGEYRANVRKAQAAARLVPLAVPEVNMQVSEREEQEAGGQEFEEQEVGEDEVDGTNIWGPPLSEAAPSADEWDAKKEIHMPLWQTPAPERQLLERSLEAHISLGNPKVPEWFWTVERRSSCDF